MKTYDYINCVVLTLPLSVYKGTWTHSPLSLLCITMILWCIGFFLNYSIPQQCNPSRVIPQVFPLLLDTRLLWLL